GAASLLRLLPEPHGGAANRILTVRHRAPYARGALEPDLHLGRRISALGDLDRAGHSARVQGMVGDDLHLLPLARLAVGLEPELAFEVRDPRRAEEQGPVEDFLEELTFLSDVEGEPRKRPRKRLPVRIEDAPADL